MGRRVSLPGAAELFRSTAPAPATPLRPVPGVHAVPADEPGATPGVPHPGGLATPGGDELGERIAVRLPASLLLDMERVRVHLARDHALPVSRSELVVAALAAAIEEFDAAGDGSELARRLGDA